MLKIIKAKNAQYFSRFLHTAMIAALLMIFEVFVVNEPWFAYERLHLQYAEFHLSISRLILYVVILVVVWFWPRIYPVLKKLDHRVVPCTDAKMLSQNHTNYAKIFALLCMTFGVILVFFSPPFSAPDEVSHFEQSYYVAHGQLMPKVDAQGNAYGIVDEGDLNFRLTWPGVTFDSSKKVAYADMLKALESPANNTPAKIAYRYYLYSFVLYMPQAVGMIAGKMLFHLFRMSQYYNTYQQMLFARLFNLVFYAAVVTCAIKIVPIFKRTMMFVALMPMAIYIAASCSADTFLYAISFLSVAYILRLAYAQGVKKIGKKEVACLAVLCSLLFLCKSIYVLLFFLCLLIPKDRFNGMKKKIFHLTLAFLIGCVVFGIWYVSLKMLTKTMSSGCSYVWGANGVAVAKSESMQAHYVLTHPIHYLMIAYNDFFAQGGYLVTLIGRFGWLDTIVPTAFTVLYATLLLLSALMEKFSVHLAKWKRLWIFFLSCSIVILVQTSQYVSWTPHPQYIGGLGIIGGVQIIGVQGRYFIPILLMALFMLANRFTVRFRVLSKINSLFDHFAGVLVVASLNICMLFIFLRFWIH